MMTQDPLAHLQQRLPLAEPYRPEFLMDEVDVLLTSIERDRWTFENLIIDPDYRSGSKSGRSSGGSTPLQRSRATGSMKKTQRVF